PPKRRTPTSAGCPSSSRTITPPPALTPERCSTGAPEVSTCSPTCARTTSASRWSRGHARSRWRSAVFPKGVLARGDAPTRVAPAPNVVRLAKNRSRWRSAVFPKGVLARARPLSAARALLPGPVLRAPGEDDWRRCEATVLRHGPREEPLAGLGGRGGERLARPAGAWRAAGGRRPRALSPATGRA